MTIAEFNAKRVRAALSSLVLIGRRPAPRFPCKSAKLTVAILLVLTCTAFAGEDTQRKTRPNLIVWIEANAPLRPLSHVFPDRRHHRPQQLLREFALEAIQLWSRVTPRIIVSTKPSQSDDLYPYLVSRKPVGVEIIGGLKTYTLPGTAPKDPRPFHYGDSDGWRKLAAESARIARVTGVPACLFESETALSPFHSGTGTIDLVELRTSLTAIRDTGITAFWWLPHLLANTKKMPDRETKTEQLVRTFLEGVPDSKFICAYSGWHATARRAHDQQRRQAMLDLVGTEHFCDLLYVTLDGFVHRDLLRKRRCYTPSEAAREIDDHPQNQYVIYPSTPDWVQIAEALNEAFSSP